MPYKHIDLIWCTVSACERLPELCKLGCIRCLKLKITSKNIQ